MSELTFEVDEAGCESCGRLVEASLSKVGAVVRVDVDEDRDVATVVLCGPVSRRDVDAALEEASGTAGHTYRVRAGSWRHTA